MSDVKAPASEVVSLPHVLEYLYRRSVGPIVGRFLAGLRERRIEGVRTADGKVLVTPTEYDPNTGEPLDESVTAAGRSSWPLWIVASGKR